MTPARNPISVSFTALRDAFEFEFVSAGVLSEHSAYVSLDTGRIHWLSDIDGSDDGLIEDLETSDRYIAVPHKTELDLGMRLALSFVDQELPGGYQTVTGFFRWKGACPRFKQLLASRGTLQRWYDYENHATEEALRRWSEENGISPG